MRTLPFLTACLALVPLAGCGFQLGSSTHGSEGNVSFAYLACFFGCSVDQPMMLGTSEAISVDGSSIPAVTFTSSDDSVLSVVSATRSCCNDDGTCTTSDPTNEPCPQTTHDGGLVVHVRTVGVGTARLALVANDGSTYDSVALEVARPASLALSCNNAPDPLTLHANDSCSVGWTPKDAQGRSLVATTGVTLTSSDPNVVEFEGLFGPSVATIAASQGLFGTSLVTNAPGDATVTASAGDATTTLSVHVVP